MKRKLIYIDTETCGLHGMPVLIQWACEDGEIHLHEAWKVPVKETMELIEYFCEHIFVGFNNAFDWFHLSKMYTVWSLVPSDWIPEEHIDEIAELEPQGRDAPCIKPWSTFDLMLYSRKGPYQSLMARKDVRVRKIPIALAQSLADELTRTIPIDPIYFANAVDKSARWKALDIVANTGVVNKDFQDVCLKFKPAGGLKALAEYALGITPDAVFTDIELDKSNRPYELGYAPYAKALASAPDWTCKYWESSGGKKVERTGYTWPAVIQKHIDHWHTNEPAREYAYKDVVYTRKLYKHFDCPKHGDNDSVLACMVACVRWRGFQYDREGLETLRVKAVETIASAPINVHSHRKVHDYLAETMDETEQMVIAETTQKMVLEGIAEWIVDEDEACVTCLGMGTDMSDNPCPRCDGTGELKAGIHPAASRAKQLLAVKVASKEIELYDKLLTADRFHASFKIIGTLSSRMSGADGLNAQGIKHDKNVRKQFPLAGEGTVLCGGDFDSFEVTIADAVFDDEVLHQTLLSGKKFHGILGVELYPTYTYDEILASDGMEVDLYSRAKQGTFGFLYGGDAGTWQRNLGIKKKQAEKAFDSLCVKYRGIGDARNRIQDDFCSMKQTDGIGSEVKWSEPKDFCETFLGFKRYYTLENTICKALFNLANNIPQVWHDCPITVVRREREQTAAGAVSSALYGTAFQIQAKNMRASNNHLIQSPGAEITKALQRRIWDEQPYGVNVMRVAPMNIHDEVMCVTLPEYVTDVAEAVKESVESFRGHVPLIGMKWNLAMDNWAEKKESAEQIHITY